jgi:hypothetical protein
MIPLWRDWWRRNSYRMELILCLIVAFMGSMTISYGMALLGEPRNLWFWRDMLKVIS